MAVVARRLRTKGARADRLVARLTSRRRPRGAQPVPGRVEGRRRGRPRPTCPTSARARGRRCAPRHRPHRPRPRAHGPRHRADQCRRAAGRLARPAVRSRLGYGRAPRTDGPGRPDNHLRRLQAKPPAASGGGVRRARGRDRPRIRPTRSRAARAFVLEEGDAHFRADPDAHKGNGISSSSPDRSARRARRRSRPARRSGAGRVCARSRRRGRSNPSWRPRTPSP
jgi:hypothetical protein